MLHCNKGYFMACYRNVKHYFVRRNNVFVIQVSQTVQLNLPSRFVSIRCMENSTSV